MKVKVKFYAGMKELFGVSEKDIELEDGANVDRLLDFICDSRKCRDMIVDAEGRIKSDLKMVRQGRRTHFVTDVATVVDDGDIIILLPPVFGG